MHQPSRNRSSAASRSQIVGLLAIAVLASFFTHATLAEQPFRLELLGGKCRQSIAGDGIWWNSAYPHHLDPATICFQLGISKIETEYRGWDIGWRLAYVDFGTIRWQASYPLVDAEQHTINPDGKNCDQRTLRGCVGKGDHKQYTRGVSIGAVGERNAGPLIVGGDAGLYLYNSKMSYTISSPTGRGTDDFEGLGLTPYVGLSLRYGWLLLYGRVYAGIKAHESGCGDCSGVTNGTAWSMLIGLQVPL